MHPSRNKSDQLSNIEITIERNEVAFSFTKACCLVYARFFQDKRVKVSLFLSEGIQAPNGKLVLPSCIKEGLGKVRTFGPEGKCIRDERLELDCLKVSGGKSERRAQVTHPDAI